jgi:hypothetical protein
MGTVLGLTKIHNECDVFQKLFNAIGPIYPDSPGLLDGPGRDLNEL